MKRWNGGTKVEPGFYWSTSRWAIATVSEAPAALPGPGTEAYVRIPMLAMLAAGPVMGGLFAIFLPLIGFVMVFRELWRSGRRTLHFLARRPVTVVAPSDTTPRQQEKERPSGLRPAA